MYFGHTHKHVCSCMHAHTKLHYTTLHYITLHSAQTHTHTHAHTPACNECSLTISSIPYHPRLLRCNIHLILLIMYKEKCFDFNCLHSAPKKNSEKKCPVCVCYFNIWQGKIQLCPNCAPLSTTLCLE